MFACSILAVYSPSGHHYKRSELMLAAYNKFKRSKRGSLSSLSALGGDLRDALCNSRSSKHSCENGTITAVESIYATRVRSFGALLSPLADGRHLAMIMESVPSHFPDLPNQIKPWEKNSRPLEDGLDEPESYERFYMSSLAWVHERVWRNTNASLGVLALMNIDNPKISGQELMPGMIDPAYVVGFARSAEARACQGLTDVDACYADALATFSDEGGARRAHYRMRDCRPHLPSANSQSLLAAQQSVGERPAGFGWRQRIEAETAAALGVPFFRRADARRSRWDLHPGLKWARYTDPRGIFDCLHSVRAPGSFDVELLELQQALEAHALRQRTLKKL